MDADTWKTFRSAASVRQNTQVRNNNKRDNRRSDDFDGST